MPHHTQSMLALSLNSLKVALRNFSRFKFYSALNIGSLSVAFAAVILIVSYIYFETSYDQWHTKSNRIYRATYHVTGQQDFEVHWARVPVDYINKLPDEMPEIEHLVRFQNQEQKYLRIGRETYKPKHAYVTDASVFNVFDFDLLYGDQEEALSMPNSIVLTASLARKLFGQENVVGKEISLVGDWNPDEEIYKVTGIMKDMPANTHIPVELFLSFSNESSRTGWAYIYTLLKNGTSIETVNAKMQAFIAANEDSESEMTADFEFQPLSDIHLHSNLAREIIPNGSSKNVRIFLIIGLLIFFIALINFSNLSSALAMTRTREVGVRRILGARNFDLIIASMGESVFYNFISVILGGAIAYLVFPAFTDLTGIEFNFPTLYFALLLIGLILFSGLLSGWYPAWIRLAGNAINQIKSSHSFNWSSEKRWSLKRLLVTVQFTISILLVACALFAYQQFDLLSNKKLGLDKDQVLAIPSVPDRITDSYQIFKDKVSNLSGVLGVSACMEVPSREIRDMGPVSILGANPEAGDPPMMDIQIVEPDLPQLMGMELMAGNWDTWKNWPADEPRFADSGLSAADYLAQRHRKYLINETAMRRLGWQDPEEAVGQQISWSNGPFKLSYGVIRE